MEHSVLVDNADSRNFTDSSNLKEEIIVKEENIELEIDPLSLYDEGIEIDHESEKKVPYIDYSNWYKYSINDLSNGLRLPIKDKKVEESFFDSSHMRDLVHQSFVCFYCGEMLNDKFDLKVHIKYCHMPGLFIECFYCKRKFKDLKRLIAHTTRKHKQIYKKKKRKENNVVVVEKPFACKFCDYRANARCLVNYHVSRIHEKIKPFHCPHCDFRSAYNQGLINHVKSKHTSQHERVKSFIIDVCDEKLMKPQTLQAMKDLKKLKPFDLERLKPFACPKCNYRATRAIILGNHMKLKHDETHYCPHCDFKTASSLYIKVHIIKKHSKEKPQSCCHCNSQFSLSADLIEHMKIHHERRFLKGKKTYSCSYCSFDSYKISDLKSHMISEHDTVITFYSCLHCDFLSYNLEELKSHVTTEHGKVQLLPCQHCDFKCVQKEKLENHMTRWHTNLK